MAKVKAEIVTSKEVSCSGGEVGGHPKVYLNMGNKDRIACNYCGQVFQLDENAPSGDGH